MFEENKAIITEYLGLLDGDSSAYNERKPFDYFTDDIVYEIIGTTPVSGVMRGLDEIKSHLLDPFWERLDHVTVIPEQLVAIEDGRVLMIGRSDGLSTSGARYDQQYLYVFTLRDGKICHILKHCDTALIETAIFGKVIVEADPATASA